MKSPRCLTHAEWLAEGTQRFGPDRDHWRFQCPACGFVASRLDYIQAGGTAKAGVSCIGRVIGAKRRAFGDDGMPGPCDYAGGGLFRLNPVHVALPHGPIVDFMEWGPPETQPVPANPRVQS